MKRLEGRSAPPKSHHATRRVVGMTDEHAIANVGYFAMIFWFQRLASWAMSWVERLVDWALPRRGVGHPIHRSATPVRTRSLQFAVEGLERREVLSAAAVAPFLSVNGQIASAGQPAMVNFHLTAGSLTAPKTGNTVLIGLDPKPATGVTLTPRVTAITRDTGALSTPADGSNGTPFITRVAVPTGTDATYTATVRGPAGESGAFVLDGFLVGDVNGDRTVDRSDIDRILAAYGSKRGDAQYDAAADINQDGWVGCLDRSYAIENLGAKATPAATVTAATATPAPTVTTPVAAAPVVTATPVSTVEPTIAVTPVAIEAPASVNPTVAVTPVAAAPTSSVVWIPVVVPNGQTPTQAATINGLTWSPQLSAFIPTTTGTAIAPTTTTPIYYTAPSNLTPATTPSTTTATTTTATPIYYTTATNLTPAGPSYFAAPTSGLQTVLGAQATQAPVYVTTAAR